MKYTEPTFVRMQVEPVMRILLWLITSVLALLVLVVGVVVISSQFSFDRTFNHTTNTKQLPLIGDKSSGLVRIPINDYEFRARVAGMDRPDAETVILLHGFPVTSAMWIALIEPLQTAGYRVVAFDQRGYSPGARPAAATEYAVPNLVSDVVAIADALGVDQFHLVGHDWGSVVGWSTVMSHPERVLSWTGLSIAHPTAFSDALQNDPDQQARSQYFAVFTAPYLPETLLTFNDLGLLMAMYGDMREDQKNEYHAVFAEPGALTAALNWYRMMASGFSDSPLSSDIQTPTLFIWGNDDPSAGRAAVEGQRAFVKGPYKEIELDGDHWLVTSHGELIADALLEHLASVAILKE